MKISKMTEKAQKLAKDLASEKAKSDQLQKSTTNQASQQTSENRKLALELSKLKVSANVGVVKAKWLALHVYCSLLPMHADSHTLA